MHEETLQLILALVVTGDPEGVSVRQLYLYLCIRSTVALGERGPGCPSRVVATFWLLGRYLNLLILTRCLQAKWRRRRKSQPDALCSWAIRALFWRPSEGLALIRMGREASLQHRVLCDCAKIRSCVLPCYRVTVQLAPLVCYGKSFERVAKLTFRTYARSAAHGHHLVLALF